MASITKYRQKWLKYHKGYEKKAFKLLQKVFTKWNSKIINADIKEKGIKKQLESLIDMLLIMALTPIRLPVF